MNPETDGDREAGNVGTKPLFRNVVSVTLTINGREMDISALQAGFDKVGAAIVASDNPVADIEAVVERIKAAF